MTDNASWPAEAKTLPERCRSKLPKQAASETAHDTTTVAAVAKAEAVKAEAVQVELVVETATVVKAMAAMAAARPACASGGGGCGCGCGCYVRAGVSWRTLNEGVSTPPELHMEVVTLMARWIFISRLLPWRPGAALLAYRYTCFLAVRVCACASCVVRVRSVRGEGCAPLSRPCSAPQVESEHRARI